jgi:hypothetical protein
MPGIGKITTKSKRLVSLKGWIKIQGLGRNQKLSIVDKEILAGVSQTLRDLEIAARRLTLAEGQNIATGVTN